MLLNANLDKKYWAEAVNTANFLQNRLPTRTTAKTPYELMYKRKPDVRNPHIFGCDAYIQIPKEQRRKLDDKAKKLTFVGYSEESKAFRLLDKNKNRIKISRDVIFLDKENEGQVSSQGNEEIILTMNETSKEEIQETSSEEDLSSSFSESINDTESSTNSSSQDRFQPVKARRSERSNKRVPPNRYMAITKLAATNKEDPRNRKETLSGINKEEWKKAMDEEINSLLSNKTWDIVPAPEGRDIVTCKWIFKTKRNEQGKVTRYKARLGARGFSPKYGTDYDEVFAPVVRQTTFKLLLTIAGSKEGLIIKHYDAKTAFLNGELDQVIFMRQPDGYEIVNKEGTVCKLKKGLYGLKQAAKLWNEKLNDILINLDFIQSKTDHCLYLKGSKKEDMIYIIIHVDDILIVSKNIERINETAECLKKRFHLVDLGILQRYLGIEVRRNEEGFYCIKQSQYIENILNRFGLQDAKI